MHDQITLQGLESDREAHTCAHAAYEQAWQSLLGRELQFRSVRWLPEDFSLGAGQQVLQCRN